MFEDNEEFPASYDSLLTSHKKFNVDEIVWLRPKEIVEAYNFDNDIVAKFIDEKPTICDVMQGDLGDCWLLASMANLPTYPDKFEQVVPTDNIEFEDENYCGEFHFRFWQYGNWIDIVIDDRLPTYEGKLIFARSEHENVFWSALLEKAYAKLHKSYQALDGGWMAESFEDFTGGIAEVFPIPKEDYAEEFDTQKLFDHIKTSIQNGSLCGAAIAKGDEKILNSRGLFPGHAYTLTRAETLSTGTQLVRIRNPYGDDKEWSNEWSDGSLSWEKISEEEKEELNLILDDDGEFWLSWEDCQKNFTQIEIGHFKYSSISSDNHEHSESNALMSPIDDEKLRKANCEEDNEIEENCEEGDDDEIQNRVTSEEECLQCMCVSVLKPEDAEDDGVFQLVFSIILRNRRVLKVLGAEDIHFQLYEIEEGEIDSTWVPNEEFFEEKEPLEYARTYNYSNEFIISSDVKAGEYCAVILSESNDKYFVRAFSESDVTITPIWGENDA